MIALTYFDLNETERRVWQETGAFALDLAGNIFAADGGSKLFLARFRDRRLEGLYRIKSGSPLVRGGSPGVIPVRGAHFETAPASPDVTPLPGPRFELAAGYEGEHGYIEASIDGLLLPPSRWYGLAIDAAAITIFAGEEVVAKSTPLGWRHGQYLTDEILFRFALHPAAVEKPGPRSRPSELASSVNRS